MGGIIIIILLGIVMVSLGAFMVIQSFMDLRDANKAEKEG